MAEKNSAQTDRQTNRHYENNGQLAVNQHDKHAQICKLGTREFNALMQHEGHFV